MNSRWLALTRLAIAVILFVLALGSLDAPLRPGAPRLDSTEELRATLRRRPAHLPAYQRVAEAAFDLPGAAGVRLWHAAYAMVAKLSPDWPAMRRNFVRQGFFHWPELGRKERDLVLREVAVLMRDPVTFLHLYEPMWQLTRDLNYLRANAPRDARPWERLIALAARHGEFDHYRRMRDELPGVFVEQRRRSPDEVFADLLMMEQSFSTRDEMAALMKRLAATPPTGIGHDPNRLAQFVDYAVRTRLPGIEALVYVAEADSGAPPQLRARVALATRNVTLADRIEHESLTRTPDWTPYLIERAQSHLENGDPARAEQALRLIAPAEANSPSVVLTRAEVAERRGNREAASMLRKELQKRLPPGRLHPARWSGLCDRTLCQGFADTSVYTTEIAPVSFTVDSAYRGPVSPYLEVFADAHRVAEGEITGSRTFQLTLPPGLHQLHVRVINTVDAQGARRVVQLGG